MKEKLKNFPFSTFSKRAHYIDSTFLINGFQNQFHFLHNFFSSFLFIFVILINCVFLQRFQQVLLFYSVVFCSVTVLCYFAEDEYRQVTYSLVPHSEKIEKKQQNVEQKKWKKELDAQKYFTNAWRISVEKFFFCCSARQR